MYRIKYHSVIRINSIMPDITVRTDIDAFMQGATNAISLSAVGAVNVNNNGTDFENLSATLFNLGGGTAATKDSSIGNGIVDAGKLVEFANDGGVFVTMPGVADSAITGTATGSFGIGVSGIANTSFGNGKGILGVAMGAYGDTAIDGYVVADAGIILRLSSYAPQFGGTGVFLRVFGDGDVIMHTVFKTNFLAALGIPTYDDLTAANAALNSGDIYFDTALGSCRAATA